MNGRALFWGGFLCGAVFGISVMTGLLLLLLRSTP